MSDEDFEICNNTENGTIDRKKILGKITTCDILLNDFSGEWYEENNNNNNVTNYSYSYLINNNYGLKSNSSQDYINISVNNLNRFVSPKHDFKFGEAFKPSRPGGRGKMKPSDLQKAEEMIGYLGFIYRRILRIGGTSSGVTSEINKLLISSISDFLQSITNIFKFDSIDKEDLGETKDVNMSVYSRDFEKNWGTFIGDDETWFKISSEVIANLNSFVNINYDDSMKTLFANLEIKYLDTKMLGGNIFGGADKKEDEVWEVIVDSDINSYYFKKNGVFQWDKPDDLDQKWLPVIDEESGDFYYIFLESGERTWEEPDDLELSSNYLENLKKDNDNNIFSALNKSQRKGNLGKIYVEFAEGWKEGMIESRELKAKEQILKIKFKLDNIRCPKGDNLEEGKKITILNPDGVWINGKIQNVERDRFTFKRPNSGRDEIFYYDDYYLYTDQGKINSVDSSKGDKYICKFCHVSKNSKNDNNKCTGEIMEFVYKNSGFLYREERKGKGKIKHMHNFKLEEKSIGGGIQIGGISKLNYSEIFVKAKPFYILLKTIYNKLVNKVGDIVSKRIELKLGGSDKFFIPGNTTGVESFKFFSYKRMGDWGQVLISKYNNYTLVTIDRLAFAFAILADVNCILQKREVDKRDAIHNFNYVCYKSSNPKTNEYIWRNKNKNTNVDDQGRKVNTFNIFEGPVYDHFKNKYSFSGSDNISDDEYKTILHLLFMSLDSYHDWKGSDGRKWKIGYENILSCMNVDDNLKTKLLSLYNKIVNSNNNKKDIPKNFEGTIVDTVIKLAEIVDTSEHSSNTQTYNFIEYTGSRPDIIDSVNKKIINQGSNDILDNNTTFWKKNLQYQSCEIYNFFDNGEDELFFIEDATLNKDVFKFLQRRDIWRYPVKYIKNYYSSYDGAVGKLWDTQRPLDILLDHTAETKGSWKNDGDQYHFDFFDEEDEKWTGANFDTMKLKGMSMSKIFKHSNTSEIPNKPPTSGEKSCWGIIDLGSKRNKGKVTPIQFPKGTTSDYHSIGLSLVSYFLNDDKAKMLIYRKISSNPVHIDRSPPIKTVKNNLNKIYNKYLLKINSSIYFPDN